MSFVLLAFFHSHTRYSFAVMSWSYDKTLETLGIVENKLT